MSGAEQVPPQGGAAQGGTPDTQKSPEELRSEIEQTRGELGDTVEQLAAKADVKGRVQEEVDHRKQEAREKVDELKERVTSQAEEVKGRIAGATPEDAQQGARAGAERIKQRPNDAIILGLALAGVGIALLSRRRRR